MILPTIWVPTSQDTFDMSFKYFIKDSINEKDVEIKLNYEKIGQFVNRYEVNSVHHDIIGSEYKEIRFGVIDTYPISRDKLEIRIASLETKPDELRVDFFNSLYVMIFRKWYWGTTTEPYISRSYAFDISEIDPVGDYLKHVFTNLGFDEKYYWSKDYLQPDENAEAEKKRQILLNTLKRRLPSRRELEEDFDDSTQQKYLRGPSEWRIRRANLFKKLKDQDSSLSQKELADKATDVAFIELRKILKEEFPDLNSPELEVTLTERFKAEFCPTKDHFSDDDVGNDYDTMGWEWKDSRKLDNR